METVLLRTLVKVLLTLDLNPDIRAELELLLKAQEHREQLRLCQRIQEICDALTSS